MNPQMMMMMLPMFMQAMQGMGGMGGDMGGKEGEFKSTYGSGALDTLDKIQQQVKGGFGGQNQDVTKNPNYQTGQNWLQSMFNDPQFFNQFEAPIQRQFEEQTVPDLLNKYGAMGSGGAMSSGGLQRNLAREAGNLHTNIAALRGGMQQQAIPQLLGYAQQPTSNWMQMLQQAMTPTQNQYQPPTAGFWGDIMSSLTGGLAKGAGNFMGQQMGNLGNPAGGNQALPTNVSFPTMSRQYPGQQ